jgi:hypothetical protein
MTNKKTQIAEVLFSSEAPNDLILWALSHIPDVNEKGDYAEFGARKINHNEKTLYSAFGMTENEWDKTVDRLAIHTVKILSTAECDSEIVVRMMDIIKKDNDLMTLLLVKYVQYTRQECLLKLADDTRIALLNSIKTTTKKKGNK